MLSKTILLGVLARAGARGSSPGRPFSLPSRASVARAAARVVPRMSVRLPRTTVGRRPAGSGEQRRRHPGRRSPWLDPLEPANLRRPALPGAGPPGHSRTSARPQPVDRGLSAKAPASFSSIKSVPFRRAGPGLAQGLPGTLFGALILVGTRVEGHPRGPSRARISCWSRRPVARCTEWANASNVAWPLGSAEPARLAN